MFEGEMIYENGRPFQNFPRCLRPVETRIFPITRIILIKEDALETGERDDGRFLFNLTDDQIFCDPLMVKLLESLGETGNAHKSCTALGISYSLCWKLLAKLEKWAGYPMTRRRQGGRGGGRTDLTPKGKAFLKKHNAFMLECRAAVQKKYKKYWKQ
jgi:molybdate transport repressor ModE-like protein